MAIMLGPNHPLFGAAVRPHKLFGESLAKARVNRSFTDGALAREIGVGRDTLREWEHGYNLPSATNLRKLIGVLDLRWVGDTVINDAIGGPLSIVKPTTEQPEVYRGACDFNPEHAYMTKAVPTPRHCSPACAAAAARLEMRLTRLEIGGRR